jgi:hypothetical protein
VLFAVRLNLLRQRQNHARRKVSLRFEFGEMSVMRIPESGSL